MSTTLDRVSIMPGAPGVTAGRAAVRAVIPSTSTIADVLERARDAAVAIVELRF
jgi:hypothetical protein